MKQGIFCGALLTGVLLLASCSLQDSTGSVTLSIPNTGGGYRSVDSGSYIGVYEEYSEKIYTAPISIAEGSTSATITLDGYPLGKANFLIALAPEYYYELYIGYAQPVIKAGENELNVKLKRSSESYKINVTNDTENVYSGYVNFFPPENTDERFSLYIVNISWQFGNWSESKTQWIVADNLTSEPCIFELRNIPMGKNVTITNLTLTNYSTKRVYTYGSQNNTIETNSGSGYGTTVVFECSNR